MLEHSDENYLAIAKSIISHSNFTVHTTIIDHLKKLVASYIEWLFKLKKEVTVDTYTFTTENFVLVRDVIELLKFNLDSRRENRFFSIMLYVYMDSRNTDNKETPHA